MRLGFSSIGCPEVSLAEMADLAAEYRLDFMELRALGGTIDLPAYFAEAGLKTPKSPEIRVVATNLQLMTASDEDVAHFLKYAEAADRLRAPYLRVFGGGKWGDTLTESQMDHATQVTQECRAALRNKKITCELLLETHSAFSSSNNCLNLNKRLKEPLRILWDAHHTWRSAGEMPGESWRRIGAFVRHIHVSDSRAGAAEPGHQPYECVLPGSGEFPMAELRRILTEADYREGVSLEWEKLWHPNLPSVRAALDRFVKLMRPQELAVK